VEIREIRGQKISEGTEKASNQIRGQEFSHITSALNQIALSHR
jgi:hypothetical protein